MDPTFDERDRRIGRAICHRRASGHRHERGEQPVEHVIRHDASINDRGKIEPSICRFAHHIDDGRPRLPSEFGLGSRTTLVAGWIDAPRPHRSCRVGLDQRSASVAWCCAFPDLIGPSLLEQGAPHGDDAELVRRHRERRPSGAGLDSSIGLTVCQVGSVANSGPTAESVVRSHSGHEGDGPAERRIDTDDVDGASRFNERVVIGQALEFIRGPAARPGWRNAHDAGLRRLSGEVDAEEASHVDILHRMISGTQQWMSGVRFDANPVSMCKLSHMATNLALDPDLLDKVLEVSGEKTKKDAVTLALREFVERRTQVEVANFFGLLEWDEEFDYKAARR